MIPVLTGDEYRRVDKAFAGDLGEAMERAGYAVAMAAIRGSCLAYGKRVVVLAGPGNNGGDGYVAARILAQRGIGVEVHALGEPRSDIARSMAERAGHAGVLLRPLSQPAPADLVIDALFGGGVRLGLPKEVRAWMETESPVLAVDYPTGVDPDTGRVSDVAFRAAETVTFGSMKTGHVLGDGPDHCGLVTVADIGIEGGRPSMMIAEGADARRPRRERRSHKWNAGAVLVVGGSSGLLGASILAGRAALEFGAGTVYLTTPDIDMPQSVAPDLPTMEMSKALERLDRFDVVIAGPGLDPSDLEWALPVVAASQQTLLDAGAISPEPLAAAGKGGGQTILTPHDGEFARVAGVGAGTYAVRSFAQASGATVVRKGNPTMITDGALPVLVTTGGPELATIGTGDVLAGMIGALWARGLTAKEAAVSGTYWHGVAGHHLAATGSVTATRLLSQIGRYAW